SRRVAEDVLDYRTDVAVLAHIDENPRLLAIPYSRHGVVVFAHRDHPLARHQSVSIEALDGAGVIMREQGSTTRRAFEEALASAGVQPRVVMEIGSRESIREAVARGIGLGVVSEAELTPDERLRVIRIADAEIFTYAHVVCLKERRHRRLLAAFLGVVRDLLAEPADACGSPPPRPAPHRQQSSGA
ncbi:MAG: LysR substrate-binding domain-containing protein, partial [Burkholderiales bacterium]